MCSICDDDDVAPRLPISKPKFSWQLGRETTRPPRVPVAASQDPKDYEARDLVGVTWVRRPGDVNDQRITIENCRECFIVVMDQCDSIQVDSCRACHFFFGPTAGSVFIRDTRDCFVVVACGQLRLRDVTSCKFSMYCQSRPVVENSSRISVGCFSPHHQYFELLDHAHRAKLSIFNNLYADVHDFTPKGGNVTLLSIDQIASNFVPRLPIDVGALAADVSESEAMFEGSVVFPFVYGLLALPPSLPTVGIVGFYPGKVHTAVAMVTELELTRRGKVEGSPRLLNTIEHLFSDDGVKLLQARLTPDDAKMVGPLAGNVSIWAAILFPIASAAENYFQAMRTKCDGSVLCTVVGTQASTQELRDVLFCKLPIQGLAFGATH